MNLRGRGRICDAPGLIAKKRGFDASQDLEQQDLEEKLLHVGS